MQYKWLYKENKSNLIVFFNGWGMDEKIVSGLNSKNYDVLMFYNYKSFEPITLDLFNLVPHSAAGFLEISLRLQSNASGALLLPAPSVRLPAFSRPKFRSSPQSKCSYNYKTKNLIAWSMGVFVCNYYYDLFKDFNKYTAINGTQKPIDDKYGIPKQIYKLTVDNFNELSCKKFVSKISTSKEAKNYCTRSIKDLKEELISIRDLQIQKYIKFNKVIISLKDKIIPSKNQINYWQSQGIEPIKIQDGAHSIFEQYKDWEELI